MRRAMIPILLLVAVMQFKLSIAIDELTEADLDACKQEAKFDGNYNETTRELKCFIACLMVKGEMMDETGSLKVEQIKKFTEEEPDSSDTEEDIKERKHYFEYAIVCAENNNKVTPKSDNCEAAFDFITCLTKERSAGHHKVRRDTRFSSIVETVTWMYFYS